MRPQSGPLDGVRVVEAGPGETVVGAGMAISLPGALLRDLGAEVIAVRSSASASLDRGVEFHHSWDRGKELVVVDDHEVASVAADLACDADILIASGGEQRWERHGLGWIQLAHRNPRLILGRIRPSYTSSGPMPDLDFLVSVRTGLCTQIPGHRRGRPVFPAANLAQAGAALSATVGVLAGLYEREATGRGSWAETSLYDGLLGMLPMIIGRAERHSPFTTMHWLNQGPQESLVYRCADGEYVQLWFGAKGAFEEFLEFVGDAPSDQGYNAEMAGGGLAERGVRWSAMFGTKDRKGWLEHLAGHRFRVEPAAWPGEVLLDPHVREVGLSLDIDAPGWGPITVPGPFATIRRTDGNRAPVSVEGVQPLLTDVRVLDLSAYLAGPVATAILAELGADVVKIEPVTGDVHRAIEPLFAAGQKGKRAVAMDLKAVAAGPVLQKLFQWADVVHHNSRLGLDKQLGFDEHTVRSANPNVVYSFASGFGQTGPRAPLPCNDQLMQALTGIESSQGGYGAEPTFLSWGAIDVAGGWLSACAILAGLCARRRSGSGMSVSTSLLGAGMFLTSGAFVSKGEVISGPVLDSEQLGYGATYRLYEGADGSWLALAVLDEQEWEALSALVDGLPPSPPPLRTHDGRRQPEEKVLEAAFGSKAASDWVRLLGEAGVPVELVPTLDRAGFITGILDDPINRQLGRVVSYRLGERGQIEQTRFPLRLGPGSFPRRPLGIPGLGEHTAEVLEEVGVGDRRQLEAEGVVR
jgi:crotonobetainyl-CoA:carnitine CoA-transferase CaiB-like acyl-CoA transferase